MGNILIIGGGASGRVVTHKCSQIPEVFTNITLASKSLDKPKIIQKEVKELQGKYINIEKIDAANTKELVDLINKVEPKVVIHVALPYQNYSIMDACLETRVHYIDTATPEVRDHTGFDYKGQWAYNKKFEEKGLTALLGCGFDPGVTSIYTAYAKKHFFDKIQFLDILDCNAGNHGRRFATNFDPEINIREITMSPRHFDKKKGGWAKTPAIIDSNSIHFTFDFPITGKREAYLLYHEELESLVEHYPEIERARFWMTFGEKYLSYLRAFCKYGINTAQTLEFNSEEISPKEMMEKVGGDEMFKDKPTIEMFEKIGLLSQRKIKYDSKFIAPVVMLGSVLPKPEKLGESYIGKTVIGNIMQGEKNGVKRSVYIYNVCDHSKCYQETRSQAISYTAAVPAVIGAKMIMTKKWRGKGVFNLEQLDPDPFMRDMDKYGLPWQVEEYKDELIKDF
jgi:saccharopine dehydrogenase (NAD+, L-lysine-forming)